MDGISLSLAGPDEAEIVHDMVLALAEHQNAGAHVRSTPAELACDGLRPDGAFEALLARDADGRPVGLALHYYLYSTWNARRILFVEDLFIDAALRGSGLGRRMMAHLAGIARERGCVRMELDVKPANVARGFYERLGFGPKQDWLRYATDQAGIARLADGG